MAINPEILRAGDRRFVRRLCAFFPAAAFGHIGRRVYSSRRTDRHTSEGAAADAAIANSVKIRPLFSLSRRLAR